MARDEWEDAGQGWSGIEAELRLQGWSRTRRVVVLRRRLPGTVALTPRSDDGQGDLFWTDAQRGTGVWEFAVLATSLDLEVRSVAQLYRDRADAENAFDQLKNQRGWGGFTTRDLKRCQHMARLIASSRWSLFRNPDREAITSGRFCFTGCPPDPPRSDPADGDRAMGGGGRWSRLATDHRLLPDPGAAEQLSAEDRWRRILGSEIPPWQPAGASALAPTASGRAGGLKSRETAVQHPQLANLGSNG